MKKIVLLALFVNAISLLPVSAASVKNFDSKSQSIIVAEGAARYDVALKADQQISICQNGCFITLPNGDKVVLRGDETVEINNGKATLR